MDIVKFSITIDYNYPYPKITKEHILIKVTCPSTWTCLAMSTAFTCMQLLAWLQLSNVTKFNFNFFKGIRFINRCIHCKSTSE